MITLIKYSCSHNFHFRQGIIVKKQLQNLLQIDYTDERLFCKIIIKLKVGYRV